MRGLRIFENHKSDWIFGISVEKPHQKLSLERVSEIKVEKTVTLIYIYLQPYTE